jgi:hypothetical protein
MGHIMYLSGMRMLGCKLSRNGCGHNQVCETKSNAFFLEVGYDSVYPIIDGDRLLTIGIRIEDEYGKVYFNSKGVPSLPTESVGSIISDPSSGMIRIPLCIEDFSGYLRKCLGWSGLDNEYAAQNRISEIVDCFNRLIGGRVEYGGEDWTSKIWI